MKRLRRTMLYVPGNNPAMVKDAGIYPADSIMFDLEDSVSVMEKDAARFLVYEALNTIHYPDKERIVRINALYSKLGLDDLEAMVRTQKVAIRLPKTESAQDVLFCEEQIARIEEENGIPLGSTRMMAAIESAAGVLNAKEIAFASKRLIGIAIGAEDYVTDLKTTRSSDGIELLFGRSMVLLAARAAGIDAIDTVYSNVDDEAGFRAEVALIKQLGFDGKSVINPRQIKPVHEIYTPTEKEINKALAVMEAIQEANRRGSGVISLNGKMIDKPVVARAQRTLDLARETGMLGKREKHMDRIDLENVPSIGEIRALRGVFDPQGLVKDQHTLKEREQMNNKIVPSLEEAVRLSGLRDGMTVSFHHHFRNGDYIVNMVMAKLEEMGFRDLVLAASSLTDCHAPLIKQIQNGVIRRIETSGLRGELAEAVSNGLMDVPVVFRSHGGRAYAIDSGALTIDVTFLGAPSCDPYGNANGYCRQKEGGIMCGAMGYAKCDAQYAKKKIILTNNVVSYPNAPFGIPESDVDYIVEVPEIGDPAGIMSGATRFTKNPKELMIAEMAAHVIEASGRFKDGFSLQLGSGGASLAVARFLRDMMLRDHITASFALGGITGSIVDLHEEGLIKKILDVQSFDLQAAKSLMNNRFHQQISASYYASPSNEGTAVNQLDVVVLSALEVDCEYNVNVLTGSDGVIRGAIGGHPDTAFGASVAIVVCPLLRGRIPCVVNRVQTVVTPGKIVDVIVTDHGVAVNPRRVDLIEKMKDSGLPLYTIEELQQMAEQMVGKPEPIRYTEKVVGIVTYRDGSVIDLIHQVQNDG